MTMSVKHPLGDDPAAATKDSGDPILHLHQVLNWDTRKPVGAP